MKLPARIVSRSGRAASCQRAAAGPASDARLSARSAFTLVEIMIASSIGLLVVSAAMVFLQFASTSLSGTTAETFISQQAGNAIEFIQSRVRFATSVSNDNSGNVLTLGFDDNPLVDSDGDGSPCNDKDHFEQFKFVGVNGSTNTLTTNSLVYIPNTASLNKRVLISAGLHNLPGNNTFSVVNGSMVIVRFGIVDGLRTDHYQSIDIQATAVPLNRQASTNFISIFP